MLGHITLIDCMVDQASTCMVLESWNLIQMKREISPPNLTDLQNATRLNFKTKISMILLSIPEFYIMRLRF